MLFPTVTTYADHGRLAHAIVCAGIITLVVALLMGAVIRRRAAVVGTAVVGVLAGAVGAYWYSPVTITSKQTQQAAQHRVDTWTSATAKGSDQQRFDAVAAASRSILHTDPVTVEDPWVTRSANGLEGLFGASTPVGVGWVTVLAADRTLVSCSVTVGVPTWQGERVSITSCDTPSKGLPQASTQPAGDVLDLATQHDDHATAAALARYGWTMNGPSPDNRSIFHSAQDLSFPVLDPAGHPYLCQLLPVWLSIQIPQDAPGPYRLACYRGDSMTAQWLPLLTNPYN